MGGGEGEQVDALVPDLRGERGRVVAYGVLDQVEPVSGGQAQPPLPGGVEAERGGLRGPQPAAGSGRGRGRGRGTGRGRRGGQERGAVVVVQVGQLPVLDLYALGAAGRAAGEGEVGHVVRPQRAGPVAVAGGVGGRLLLLQGPCGRRGAEVEERVRRTGVGAGRRPGRQHAHGRGVGEQLPGARHRVVGVQRQAGGPGLEYGQQCDGVVGGAGQRDRDGAAGARAPGEQQVGEPVGARVEFAAGEGDGGAARAAHQRGRRGFRARPLLECRVQQLPAEVGLGPAAPLQDARPLLRRQQFDVGQRCRLGGAGEGVQQREEAAVVGAAIRSAG